MNRSEYRRLESAARAMRTGRAYLDSKDRARVAGCASTPMCAYRWERAREALHAHLTGPLRADPDDRSLVSWMVRGEMAGIRQLRADFPGHRRLLP